MMNADTKKPNCRPSCNTKVEKNNPISKPNKNNLANENNGKSQWLARSESNVTEKEKEREREKKRKIKPCKSCPTISGLVKD